MPLIEIIYWSLSLVTVIVVFIMGSRPSIALLGSLGFGLITSLILWISIAKKKSNFYELLFKVKGKADYGLFQTNGKTDLGLLFHAIDAGSIDVSPKEIKYLQSLKRTDYSFITMVITFVLEFCINNGI
ncbi:MAG: hypothetical protein IJM17_06465 [Firmicutes bacterium]|nr:hypothetical protein [Bacillota bacterium]